VEYTGEFISAKMGDKMVDQTYTYHFELQGHHYCESVFISAFAVYLLAGDA